MRLFDTHCHLQDPAFDDLDAVVERARRAGVTRMLVCGYDGPSTEAAVAMASRYEEVLAAGGTHPHDAKDFGAADADRIVDLAASGAIAAIGEIGLDFYRELSPRNVQERVLETQLEIALAAAKPVSVHSRGAEEAIFAALERFARRSAVAPGVMHCFGGDLPQARRYIELGFLISIPCTVTYPNNERGRTLAREVPLESLVVETDSPYLPPQELRGRRNEPANVGSAVVTIASLRGLAPADVAAATTANACRVFVDSRVNETVAR